MRKPHEKAVGLPPFLLALFGAREGFDGPANSIGQPIRRERPLRLAALVAQRDARREPLTQACLSAPVLDKKRGSDRHRSEHDRVLAAVHG